SVLFDSPSDEMRSLQQQQQQQQLEHASWSISTSSLIEDAARQQTMRRSSILARPGRRKLGVGRPHPMESLADDAGSSLPWAAGRAHEQRHRKKRKSFLSRLSGSNRVKGGGSGGGGKIKGGGSRLATYEHSWRIATAGVCAVCEARQSRVCLLVCRVCHLTVHNADACRSQTVPCLPPMASQAACGAAAPAATACRDLSRLPLVLHSGSPLRRLAEVSEEPFRDRLEILQAAFRFSGPPCAALLISSRWRQSPIALPSADVIIGAPGAAGGTGLLAAPKPPPKTYLTSPSFTLQKSSGGSGGGGTLPRNFSNSNFEAGGGSLSVHFLAAGSGSGRHLCLVLPHRPRPPRPQCSTAPDTPAPLRLRGIEEAAAGSSQQHQPATSRNVRANSVSNDRRGPGGGLDSADSTGATWQASVTASLRPTSALAGGGSAVQQLSEHLARLSDATLDSLSSESLRRVSSWSETQEKKQLKRCGEKQVRRCNFIYELVSTELNHLRNIRVLRAVFRDPLLLQWRRGQAVPAPDELERLHTCLLRDLRDCDPPADRLPNDWPGLGRVGAVLRRHLGEPRGADWLQAYGGFCSEHTLRLQKAPAGIAQRWPEFADLLQQCERSPMAGRKTLQRLSKYKTLFPQISEYCQLAPEDPDMPRACQDLDRLLEGVNATVESSHNRAPAGADRGRPEQSGLSADQLMSRSLLHSGHLKLQTSEMKSHVPCFAVLLNDMLVFLQELPGDRYSPLACPSRYVPRDRRHRAENESGKSKATFFIIIKKPDPALINLACMSLEEEEQMAAPHQP
uniref:DH domain-containing protein n=1 Tax=Macrostomum lignano TaxID=282301 RepID=A0A1I8JPK9_9PLAT